MLVAFTTVRIIHAFFQVLNIAILVYCIMSWIPGARGTSFYNIIALITEPILAPVRHLFNKSPIGGGSVDFSPIIAIIFLSVAERLILSLISILLI